MKAILENKKILIIIITGALFIGGLFGWIVKPSGGHESPGTLMKDHRDHTEEVWTCSMHPQIRQSEPGKCPICGMDLIPLNSRRSASNDPLIHEMTPEAMAMASVHTSRVTRGSPEGEVHLTGKIRADERRLASITAKFPGRIEQLFVSYTGQLVRPGERLATVYSPELVTAQNELREAVKSKVTYPELYASAREKLRLWKLTEKQIDEIEKSGKITDKFDVLADKGGVVTQRNIALGDYVSTGSVLFNVADLSRVWVMIDAYETDLPFTKMGDEVTFTVAAIPGKTFTAKVTYIDPVINPGTRAASVRAEAVNSNMELKPEMFVNARIRSVVKGGKQTLAIPRTALLWSGKRSIVYVRVPDTEFPSFEMREVTIGPRMGEMYLIEAGLEAEEEVVTNGVFAIDAAAQLSGNYSMMMRPKAKTMETPEAFREQITTVTEAYFQLKNSLVASDMNAAKKALHVLNNILARVDMRSLKGRAHEHWMGLKASLDKDLQQLTETGDLKTIRHHFAGLSKNIVDMVESFGVEKDKVFKVFCPMALDNNGAYWLSETEDIRNPYFGDAMLTCGEVKETYRKGQRVFEKDGPVQQQSGLHTH
jgi:membrane fusion protein, copper/silver efflux system